MYLPFFSLKMCTRLRLLSARYGPAEGRHDAITGAPVSQAHPETHVPYTRDVLPFLRALASCSSEDEDNDRGVAERGGDGGVEDEAARRSPVGVRPEGEDGEEEEGEQAQTTRTQRTDQNKAFAPMDGRPMNTVFGDPCPGVTKVLRVEYAFRDYHHAAEGEKSARADEDAVENSRKTYDAEGDGRDRRGRQRRRCRRCTTSRTFRSAFREHERVLLRRQEPLLPLAMTDGDDKNPPTKEPLHCDHGMSKEKMESANGRGSTDQMDVEPSGSPSIPSSIARTTRSPQSPPSSPRKKPCRLATTISNVTLPIILPYLNVRRRATCQLVCRSWRNAVLENGITPVIDVNDDGLFPKRDPATNSTAALPVHNNILRGLLNHSHSSLEALVLNDFASLRPAVDLHPALPHLRKLWRLDISRVPSITDDTLRLISTSVGSRLEVLYMKGLRGITNDGVAQLVESCPNLRVLDVSQVYHLDDAAGTAIGTRLRRLEVFHAKDNHRLTNRSVDLITGNGRLLQATFWGCVRLTGVRFVDAGPPPTEEDEADSGGVAAPPVLASPSRTPAAKRLVLLNLWGCHNLADDAAQQIIHLPQLRSLCVSECHRLTDRFVVGISPLGPRLMHLQLRYLKLITDTSLECVAQKMTSLYSLDVSFCTKLSVGGVVRLLTESKSLAELRLYSCRQLDVEGGGGLPMMNGVGGNHGRNGAGAGNNGRRFVRALKSADMQRELKAGTISFLDLRGCQQHEPFIRDELFLNGMAALGFAEAMRSLFVRPAGWNKQLKRQLMVNLSNHDKGV